MVGGLDGGLVGEFDGRLSKAETAKNHENHGRFGRYAKTGKWKEKGMKPDQDLLYIGPYNYLVEIERYVS